MDIYDTSCGIKHPDSYLYCERDYGHEDEHGTYNSLGVYIEWEAGQ